MATVTLDKVNKVYPNGFHAIHDLDIQVAEITTRGKLLDSPSATPAGDPAQSSVTTAT